MKVRTVEAHSAVHTLTGLRHTAVASVSREPSSSWAHNKTQQVTRLKCSQPDLIEPTCQVYVPASMPRRAGRPLCYLPGKSPACSRCNYHRQILGCTTSHLLTARLCQLDKVCKHTLESQHKELAVWETECNFV